MTLALSSASSPAFGGTRCTEEVFSVGEHVVAGELCAENPPNRRILLITSHGATYNRLYWDWPQDPHVHSFVRNMAAHVSVLNIDLVGSGRSSRPLSPHAIQPARAAVLHELVGIMGFRGFERIVLVGHSAGSGTVTLEAATYHDVGGLIVTGFLHRPAPPPPVGGSAVPQSLYPALDAAFATAKLDPGYLTTGPGTRRNPGFYNQAVADPAVIAYDDAHKDAVSAAYVAGFLAIVNDPSVSRAVTVPVLSLVGNYDGGFCDSPACPQAADEPAAWSPAAELELQLIPGAATTSISTAAIHVASEFAYVREWLDRRFNRALTAAA